MKKKIAGLSAFIFVVLFAVIAVFGFTACSYDDAKEVTKFGDVSSNEFEYPEGKSQRVFIPTPESDVNDLAGMTDGDAVFSVGDISISPSNYSDGNVIYWVSGTSAQMTAEVATWWADGAEEGDDYITVKILVNEGETISFTTAHGETKTYTNEGTDTDGIDNGYLYLGIRLSGTYDDGEAVELQVTYDFTITWMGTETVETGDTEWIAVVDEDGEPVLDEDGEPVTVEVPVTEEIEVEKTETFYINVNSVSLSGAVASVE